MSVVNPLLLFRVFLLLSVASFAVQAQANLAPDCDSAYVSPAVLWPPNHKFESLEIKGVNDPDGDDVSVSIQCVKQDEPVNASGDGNTEYDAAGIGSSVAEIRRERSGGGNGRVYHIRFLATDSEGNACRGATKAQVPRSRRGSAIDGGALHDSTSLQIDCSTEPYNNPPSITSSVIASATEGLSYRYDVDATDPDRDELIYSLSVSPEGMSIHPETGVISWIPTFNQSGSHTATVTVRDAGGLDDSQQFSLNVINVNREPSITSAPLKEATTNELYTYTVEASDPDGDSLTYTLVSAPAGMSIEAQTGAVNWIPNTAGSYPIEISIHDEAGGSVTQIYTLSVSAAGIPPEVTITLPIDQAHFLTVDKVSFSAQANDSEDGDLSYTIEWHSSIDGVIGYGAQIFASLSAGSHTVTAVTTDSDGQSASDLMTLFIDDIALPPEPSTVAPAVDQTAITSMADRISFLYSSDNPLQSGASTSSFDDNRVGVVSGTVIDRAGNPVLGAVISVHGHPEYGQTLTREDGAFDIAINGGAETIINVDKDGYLPAQRRTPVGWNEMVALEEITVIGLDPVATPIDLSGATQVFQVARSTVQTDADGAREAVVLFPPGVNATVTLPDGTQNSIQQATVRATEYSVGSNGLSSMPGALPMNTAYTYAVELSVDEAIVSGATRVDFDQNLPVYVDNFLNFPTGTHVPSGWYDRELGAWIPSEDGRVIEVLSIAEGFAELDIDGDGAAESQEALTELGISHSEVVSLAGIYQAGQSLWRVPVDHFTPWDFNFPGGLPLDAIEPPDDTPEPETPDELDSEETDECEGCVIDPQRLTLGEEIGLVGMAQSLNYRSDRVPGRLSRRSIKINLANDRALPLSLQSIAVELTVAGKRFHKRFSPQSDLTFEYEWDGFDRYGRELSSAEAVVRVSYEYNTAFFPTPEETIRSFNLIRATGAQLGERTAQVTPVERTHRVRLINDMPDAAGLGAWTLSNHHVYDPEARVLYFGNGDKRNTSSLPNISVTVAGDGSYRFGEDGLALDTGFINVSDLEVDALGQVYVAEYATHRVRRINLDGTIETIAGVGVAGFSGDGGPSTSALLNGPNALAIDSAGNLYIGDNGNNRIRKVDTHGIISTVAGSGAQGFAGEGVHALEAGFSSIADIEVSSDGQIYVSDGNSYRIRRIDPERIIHTVAGIGTRGVSGNEGIATEAGLQTPSAIAFGENNDLYIGSGSLYSSGIRRVRDNGMITSELMNLTRESRELETDPDGNIYISTSAYRIVKVDRYGRATTLVGSGQNSNNNESPFADGMPSLNEALRQPTVFAISPNGDLYYYHATERVIRKMTSAFPGVGASEYVVPSKDGLAAYVFDNEGRHLMTIDTVTGVATSIFGYSDGLLSTVTDADGNTIQIERDMDGTPLAIIAPFGQRTDLSLDAQGYLASVTNPAGESHTMTYTPDGLLTNITNPRGFQTAFSYDERGHIITDSAPAGGWSITKQAILDTAGKNVGTSTTMSTPLGLDYTFAVERLGGGVKAFTNIRPGGSQTVKHTYPNGDEVITYPDGGKISLKRTPDPRFGMLSPITSSLEIATPSGLKKVAYTSRATTLSNSGDFLSLQELTEKLTVNGRVATSTYSALTNSWTDTSPEGRKVIRNINSRGKIASVETEGMATVYYNYDSNGRVIEVLKSDGVSHRKTSFSYGDNGYLTSMTNELGQSVDFSHNSAGRISRQVAFGDRVLGVEYDRNGNRTKVITPELSEFSYEYTGTDSLKNFTKPGMNTEAYSYGNDDRITSIDYPGEDLKVFSRDDFGRLSTISDQHHSKHFDYDSITGRLATTSSGGVDISPTYDGPLLKEEILNGEVSGAIQFRYDNDFRIIGTTVNSRPEISFRYDGDNLLVGADIMILRYSSFNRSLSSIEADGLIEKTTYTAFGERKSKSTTFGENTIWNSSYEYDGIGRIAKKTEVVDGDSTTYNYSYDEAGRLAQVEVDGIVVESYTYDKNGNVVNSYNRGITKSAQVDAGDRLLSYGQISYTFDEHGSVRSKTDGSTRSTFYTHDSDKNLRRVVLPSGDTVEYIVDGRNRRIGKKVNEQLVQGFIYKDLLNPVAEISDTGEIVAEFVYASQNHVPDLVIKEGVKYRILSDRIGSPRLVVNVQTGDIVQMMSYDAFGNVLVDTNPGFQPFGFAGGIYDRDTGLIKFGRRDYDPKQGRWMQSDPLGIDGGLNLYVYANNSPMVFIDPTGLFSVTPEAGSDVCKALLEIARDPNNTFIDNGSLLVDELADETWPFGRRTHGGVDMQYVQVGYDLSNDGGLIRPLSGLAAISGLGLYSAFVSNGINLANGNPISLEETATDMRGTLLGNEIAQHGDFRDYVERHCGCK